MQQPIENDLLTEAEAARLRRQSVRTLQAERVRGGGCPFVKLGRSVRYRRADVLRFIEANVKALDQPAQRGAAAMRRISIAGQHRMLLLRPVLETVARAHAGEHRISIRK